MLVDRGDRPKRTLPALDIKTGINHSPHIVVLGAGASRACCPGGDRNGRKLPVMADFIPTLGIEDLVRDGGFDPAGNFEEIYSRIHAAGNTPLLEALDREVRSYFSQLELPYTPTLYDYILLALRPKDIIVTFNWDPLLPRAYKRWRHLGAVLPEIVFLHGNVDIGYDPDAKVFGFLSDEPYPGRALRPTPLLYPVEKKDYNTEPFIADQWQRATDFLEHSYYVTIYGYSAPATDVEARELLLKAWRVNGTRELAEFDIMDIRPKDQVEKSWSDFLAGIHGGATNNFSHNILMKHPRRSCEAFAFATLQQDPWAEDPFPKNCSLADLKRWVRPLIDEESAGKLSGKPHHD